MAERLDIMPGENTPDESKPDVSGPDETRASDGRLQDAAPGRLDERDVEDSPLERGTDPLSDAALDEHGREKPSLQAAFFGVLAVVFALFLIGDVVNHAWARAVLGAVVVAVCVFATLRELKGSQRR